MKKLLSIFLFFLICFLLTSSALAKKGSVPASEIAAIEQTYAGIADLSAHFTQETDVKLLKRTITRRGTFEYRKGGMFRIAYADKGGKHYVCDGETIWVFVPGDAASVQAFVANDRSVPKEAFNFFGGFSKLAKEFKVSQSKSFEKIPEGSTALHLVPRKRSAHYTALDARFGPDHLLRELVVHNRSGNVTRYNFKRIQTNTGLPAGRFTHADGVAMPDILPQ